MLVDTEAVLQRALIQVWNRAPRVEDRGEGDPLLRYALRVARNEALDEAARQARGRPVPEEDAADGLVEPEVLSPGFRQAAGECLGRLPGRPRAAFEARLAGEGADGDAALAAAAGMTAATFRQNLRRARVALQDCLRRRGFREAEVRP
jgi:DNA-directed RNA polymerase specialized sigma24 family protein